MENLNSGRIFYLIKNLDRQPDKNNLRPIQIQTLYTKIREKCLLYELRSYVETSTKQIGFKKGYNQRNGLQFVREKIELSKDAMFILIDVSKAFDSMKHELLLRKIHLSI